MVLADHRPKKYGLGSAEIGVKCGWVLLGFMPS